RTTRRTLRGSTNSSASGSTRRISSTNSEGARDSSSARRLSSGGTRGTRQPSSSAQTYCPVPPTSSGSFPRDQPSSSASFATSSQRPRLKGTSGSTTSSK